MKGEEVGRAEAGPRGASRAWGRVCTGFQRQQEPLEGVNTSAKKKKERKEKKKKN